MDAPLNILCYGPGVGGAPSTAFPLPDIKRRIDAYQHTISDQFGFESCLIRLSMTVAEAVDWLQNGLMRSIIVSGPNAEICWEGFLETVTVTLGQKKASLSLHDMANHVRVLFTTASGGSGESQFVATDASRLSLSVYGYKEFLGSLANVYQATADAACAKILANLALPRSAQSTTAATGALGEVTVELLFAGWYATADWVLVSNSSGSLSTVHSQLTTIWLPGLASNNAFLSTDYSGITFTGANYSQYVAHYSTYKQVIDERMNGGDSASQPLAYGVFEQRRFCAVVSAAATPTVVTYQEDASGGFVLDAYGNQVAPWDVRPNAISQVIQLLDVGPPVGVIDAAARKYVSRVTCSISGDSIGCTLEPQGGGDLETIAAIFGRTYYGS